MKGNGLIVYRVVGEQMCGVFHCQSIPWAWINFDKAPLFAVTLLVWSDNEDVFIRITVKQTERVKETTSLCRHCLEFLLEDGRMNGFVSTLCETFDPPPPTLLLPLPMLTCSVLLPALAQISAKAPTGVYCSLVLEDLLPNCLNSNGYRNKEMFYTNLQFLQKLQH